MIDVKSTFLIVREHIPLEQGLRPWSLVLTAARTINGQRAYSIRTRIKTDANSPPIRLRGVVREHIPLEQGLRLKKPSRKIMFHDDFF